MHPVEQHTKLGLTTAALATLAWGALTFRPPSRHQEVVQEVSPDLSASLDVPRLTGGTPAVRSSAGRDDTGLIGDTLPPSPELSWEEAREIMKVQRDWHNDWVPQLVQWVDTDVTWRCDSGDSTICSIPDIGQMADENRNGNYWDDLSSAQRLQAYREFFVDNFGLEIDCDVSKLRNLIEIGANYNHAMLREIPRFEALLDREVLLFLDGEPRHWRRGQAVPPRFDDHVVDRVAGGVITAGPWKTEVIFPTTIVDLNGNEVRTEIGKYVDWFEAQRNARDQHIREVVGK